MTLAGWGRWPVAEVTACRPERLTEPAARLRDTAEAPGTLIARGGGRAYGDQALNGGGRVLLTERLDRLHSFDPDSGDLVCEAGVTFDDLLDAFLPRGWISPVCPGTAYATIGGAVANDVHGKNHDRVGSLGHWVKWLDLLTPDGRTRRIGPHAEPDLFVATVGGCGLTGIILRVCLRMMRIVSSDLMVRRRKMRDLDQFMESLHEARLEHPFTVGWIDALSGGRSGNGLGRGVLEVARVAETPGPVRPERRRRMPVDLPGVALNRLSVRAFNEAYYRYMGRSDAERREPLRKVLFPLDALLDWNRLYGKRGFHQFQCVLPDDTARDGLREMLETVSRSGRASFLAVLKTLGRVGVGPLSFPRKGYTLALDFPRRADSPALVARLHALTRDHGGRAYLAKDSLLTPEDVAEMYPDLPAFREILGGVDPGGLMASDMARRLRLRAGDRP